MAPVSADGMPADGIARGVASPPPFGGGNLNGKADYGMRSITLALRYVWRKRGRTISLLLILLVVATTTLTGLAVRDAAGDAQRTIRQTLGGVFTLEQNEDDPANWRMEDVEGMGSKQVFAGEPITAELCAEVLSRVDGILGCDATTEQVLVPETVDGEILDLLDDADGTDASMEQAFATDDFGSTVTVFGSTDTRYDANFAKGYMELTEGEPIIDPAAVPGDADNGTGGDADTGSDDAADATDDADGPADTGGDTGGATAVIGDVLIGSRLAELNDLHIGDTIVLRRATVHARMGGTTVERTRTPVRITGLFDDTAKSSVLTSNWSMSNAMFTTMDVIDHARAGTAEEGFEKISFHVDDPARTAELAAEVQNLDMLDGGCYTVSQDTSDADAVAEPLAHLDGLVLALVAVALAAGTVILCLVLTSRVKERMHESGVLLCLGFGRWTILAQYLIEALLVAMVAFGLSIPVSALIGQFVGDRLLGLSQTGEGGASGGSGPNGIVGSDGMAVTHGDGMSPTFTPNDDMVDIRVAIDATTIAWLYGLGIALVAVSVGVAGIMLMRRRPKDILAAMY